MAKVLCKLKNASHSIDGVKFEKHPHGMISEEISDEQEKHYLSIPGFHRVPTPEQTQSQDAKVAAPTPGGEPPKVVAPTGSDQQNPAPPAGSAEETPPADPSF